MRVPARLAARYRYGLMGLLLLAPLAAAAQEPTGTPSLQRGASAGVAFGPYGFRLGALEIAAEMMPQQLLTARLLVGSRPVMLCFPPRSRACRLRRTTRGVPDIRLLDGDGTIHGCAGRLLPL
jgi:hypothetical protein